VQPATLEELLYRCALKDANALSALYKNSSAKLFALILRMVSRKDIAEDILQEAYINIWNRADTYREDKGAALTWMTGIARNKTIDWIRRNPLGREVNDSILTEIEDILANPDNVLSHDHQSRLLERCLDELDSSQRQAIAQVYYSGFTHQEFAKQSGNPLGTVKSWIRRGLQRMRLCLET
jgi:RNA polymerase sigma-70 factor (ECF subfamily)